MGAAPAPARRVAHAILGECRRRGARARDVLRASPAMATLSARERALAQRLVLGVTGATGVLDALVDAHLTGRIGLEPRVRDALRLSAYELCWLATPAAVAVSEGVSLVRGVRRQATGLANAVLRKVADIDAPRRARAVTRVRDATTTGEVGGARTSATPADIDDLVLASGYPPWLLERLATERGWLAAVRMACAALEPPPLYVAPNLARGSAARALDLLAAAGTDPQPTSLADAWQLMAPAALAGTRLVEDVEVVVADLAAQHVVAALRPQPGMRVLEVGQGRATKTILLENAAYAAGGFVEVVGVDSEAFKVGVATRRMEIAGLSAHVCCVTLDGRALATDNVPAELADPFDVVLLDAPCSGSGTLRRHPELAWSLSPCALDGAESLPALQLALLSAASVRVAPGGLLAYSTCSPLRTEDEDVVGRFLATPAGHTFELEATMMTDITSGGPDAHFLARLRRSKETMS